MFKFRDGSSYSKDYYTICGDKLLRIYDCKIIRVTDGMYGSKDY